MNQNLENPADGLPLDFSAPEPAKEAPAAEGLFPAETPAPAEKVVAEPEAPAAEPEAPVTYTLAAATPIMEPEAPAADVPAQEPATAEPEAPAADAPAPTPEVPEEPPRPASQYPSNRPAGTPMTVVGAETAGLPESWQDYSYGALLKALRERSGMSLKELEGDTKIASAYLRNLEEEDLKKLPPVVYVIAYIRTLCRFYRIPAEQTEKVIQPLKSQVVHSVNDNMMQEMDIDDSVQRAEVRKIRKIALICVLSLLLLSFLLLAIFLHPGRSGAAGKNPGTRFDRGPIYQLLGPPTLNLPEIPAAQ